MTDHSCQHEADIAVLLNSVRNMEKSIDDYFKKVNETNQNIYRILNGNGVDGLITKVAVHGFWLKLVWVMVFIQTTSLIGIAYSILTKGLV